MGPHIPLNFFMTRLLFMEQDKVNSLKAKSDKAEVEIIVDNPKILHEKDAKSLPALPSPPAAPEPPVAVEGWNGAKVGGWIRLGSSNKQVHPPAFSSGQDSAANALGKLGGDDDDHTDYTEESSTTLDAATPVERRSQLFPANSSRGIMGGNGGSSSNGVKRVGSNGGTRRLGQGASVKGFPRPSIMKKKSSKNSSSLSMGNGSSPSSSGAED